MRELGAQRHDLSRVAVSHRLLSNLGARSTDTD